MTLTREQAIMLNQNKLNAGIISYIEGIGPLYERDVSFLTKNRKTQNTDTFIMTNRNNLLDAYLLEKERKLKENRRKENAFTWADLIEQEKAKAIQKRVNKQREKKRQIEQREVERQQQLERQRQREIERQKQLESDPYDYSDDEDDEDELFFQLDEPKHKSNHYKKMLKSLMRLSRF